VAKILIDVVPAKVMLSSSPLLICVEIRIISLGFFYNGVDRCFCPRKLHIIYIDDFIALSHIVAELYERVMEIPVIDPTNRGPVPHLSSILLLFT
jgi:hypothetical protein